MKELVLGAKKAVTALFGGVVVWVTAVLQSADTGVTAYEWLALAVVVGTALGVYQVTNKPAS